MKNQTKPQLKHQGVNSYRLNDSRNRAESVLAKGWKELNRTESILEAILGREPIQADAEIAATIVQWFGTQRGREFFETSIKKAMGIARL